MLPPKLLFFFFRTSSAKHRSSLFLLYTTVALTAAASVLHEEKNTNKSSEVYRCSDRQKGAQILPLAHPALHNKIFIPAGYGKARILQILRIDDLFEPCIVQIPIQRPTKNTHTHTHTHTHFFPLIKLPATTKLPEEEEEDLETQKQAPQ
jgi:hypothetical protein